MAIELGTNSGFVSVAPSTDPGGTSTSARGYAHAIKVTSPSSASAITEMGCYKDNTGTPAFDIGIYSHDAGNDKPDALLAVSAGNTAANGSGWISVTGLDWAISPSTIYWLAIQIDNGLPDWQINYGATGTTWDVKVSQTALTDPWGTSDFSQDGIVALYAVYEEGAGSNTPSATPSSTPSGTPSGTPSSTPSSTPSNTPSPSATSSSTPSSTPSGTPSGTPSSTPSNTPSPSATPSSTPSSTPSGTPSSTPSSTPSATSGSNTPSSTPSSTPSNTPSETPSSTPSSTPSNTPSPSSTPSSTPSDTPSNTPSSTPSNTPSPSATPSSTPSSTPSDTPSNTPSATVSATPSSTPSSTPSNTPSPSATPSSTPSGTPSATPSGTPSSTPSNTPSPSATPSSTPSETPSSTQSSTPSSTPSGTPSATPSSTPSSTPSGTPSATPSGASAPNNTYIVYQSDGLETIVDLELVERMTDTEVTYYKDVILNTEIPIKFNNSYGLIPKITWADFDTQLQILGGDSTSFGGSLYIKPGDASDVGGYAGNLYILGGRANSGNPGYVIIGDTPGTINIPAADYPQSLVVQKDLDVHRNAYIDGDLRLVYTTSGNYSGFKAPTLSGNSVYTLPTSFPAGNNYLLKSSTSGVMDWTDPSTLGGVTTVSNSDGTLTISPTSGSVVASLNLNHSNTWTQPQNITNPSDGVAVTLTGYSAQTNNIWEYQSSAFALLAYIGPNGEAQFGNAAVTGISTIAMGLTVNNDGGGTVNDNFLVKGAGYDFFKVDVVNGYIMQDTTRKYHFRDTAIGIYSQADTFLDLFADGSVRIGNSSAGAPTTYLAIEPTGDSYFVGEGSGIPFAEIYVKDSSATISLDADNADVKVTQFTTNGLSNNCTADAANDKITITKAGKYKVMCNLVASIDAGATTDLIVSVYLNGTIQNNIHANKTLVTSNPNTQMTISGIIDVTTVPWDVDVRANVMDTTARNVTFSDINLSVFQLGGT